MSVYDAISTLGFGRKYLFVVNCVSLSADVSALSKLVMSTLDKDSGVTLPPLLGAATLDERNGKWTRSLHKLKTPPPAV